MDTRLSRDQHKSEVVSFLQKNIGNQNWAIELPPHGTGQETYFARSQGRSFFIKLGAKIERYLVMSELGLSPSVITAGHLENGVSILVQQQVNGKKPSRKDFHNYLMKFAESIRITHHSERLKNILPERLSSRYTDVGLETLKDIEQRWKACKSRVPAFADYVDRKIDYLIDQVGQFKGSGLVASHNDVCDGNWLVSSDGKIYLLDYESMLLDDPALDMGALLWWYYPPKMRHEFLLHAGYHDDEDFRTRMRIRMAVHNLNIIIPRDNSFDRFAPDAFNDALVDFRAVIGGRENPQGYCSEKQ